MRREAVLTAAREGLVAMPYEQNHGAYSRLCQFACVYLFHASSDFYSCPLVMSDGAARTLLKSDNSVAIERAVPKLTSRDPAVAWTAVNG
jgi:acyl-CoA dehydrogenase